MISLILGKVSISTRFRRNQQQQVANYVFLMKDRSAQHGLHPQSTVRCGNTPKYASSRVIITPVFGIKIHVGTHPWGHLWNTQNKKHGNEPWGWLQQNTYRWTIYTWNTYIHYIYTYSAEEISKSHTIVGLGEPPKTLIVHENTCFSDQPLTAAAADITHRLDS